MIFYEGESGDRLPTIASDYLPAKLPAYGNGKVRELPRAQPSGIDMPIIPEYTTWWYTVTVNATLVRSYLKPAPPTLSATLRTFVNGK